MFGRIIIIIITIITGIKTIIDSEVKGGVLIMNKLTGIKIDQMENIDNNQEIEVLKVINLEDGMGVKKNNPTTSQETR